MDGQMVLDNKPIDIRVRFISRRIEIYSVETGENYLTGKCQYEPEKCTVEVKKEEDKIFNGQYDTIIFIKQSLEETETESLY